MTRKFFTMSLVTVMSLAFAATALAAPQAIPAKQAEVKAALNTMNVGVHDERVVFNKYGRQDLVLLATAPKMDIVKEVRRAYLTGKTINGYRVLGFGHQYATDTYTVTMSNGPERYIVEVGDDAKGSSLAIWGLVRTKDAKPTPAHLLNRKSLR